MYYILLILIFVIIIILIIIGMNKNNQKSRGEHNLELDNNEKRYSELNKKFKNKCTTNDVLQNSIYNLEEKNNTLINKIETLNKNIVDFKKSQKEYSNNRGRFGEFSFTHQMKHLINKNNYKNFQYIVTKVQFLTLIKYNEEIYG